MLGPGDVVGERSLVTGEPSITSVVVCAENTFTLLLSREEFMSVMPQGSQNNLARVRYVSQ
eukprot:2608632-Prymnesium_polylepis.1